ncbi:SPOR domain-containing protein [Desulfatitalea tepidiphila]|uniref:SPOR domain-containing protein n=1 Tax=Desulfatitalea tepidiphila TaxID=1185843 RepID=UPI00128EBAA9|nr:SPOR domain-containing protein [Desulfatitalea tepidiphila]
MKRKTIPQEIRGTIPWGWLIGLALLIVAAGVTLLLLPKPTPHTAPPPIVTAKIPQVPETRPQPATDEEAGDSAQGTAAGDITKESTAPEAVQDDAFPDADGSAASARESDAGADSAESNVKDEAKPPLAAVAPSTPSTPSKPETSPATPASSESAAQTEGATAAEEPTPSRERPPASADDSTSAGEENEAEPAAAAPAETDEKAPVPTQVSTFQGYTIQVGAYRNKENADAKMADLQQRGYPAYLFEVTDARRRSFYMVRFGQFDGHQEASETLADFKEKENMQAVIVRAGSM